MVDQILRVENIWQANERSNLHVFFQSCIASSVVFTYPTMRTFGLCQLRKRQPVWRALSFNLVWTTPIRYIELIGMSLQNFSTLQRLQNRLARIVTFSRKRSHIINPHTASLASDPPTGRLQGISDYLQNSNVCWVCLDVKLTDYIVSRNLRWAEMKVLVVPDYSCLCFQGCDFSRVELITTSNNKRVKCAENWD